MKEQFTVKDNQVNIKVSIHEYNGVHFNGELTFKGNVLYVNKIRDAFGNAIIYIVDNEDKGKL